jgi:Tol biopolymer transport system component
MKTNDPGLDPRLVDELAGWLEDAYVPASPRNLEAVIERTRGTRQRPAWSSLERWLPMAVITARPAMAFPLRLAWLVLITLLVLAIAAGSFIAGSQLFNSTAPIPQGGAAVLAFSSEDGDLYTIRADGTDRRQLTSGPQKDTMPVWSPDGTRIAFRSIDGDTISVAIMDARGGDPTVIHSTTLVLPPSDCFPRAPAWSPDGSWLAFTADGCGEPADAYVASVDGSTPATRFLEPAVQASGISWSTSADDGTRIAIAGSGTDGETGIYVVDVPAVRPISGVAGFSARRISGDTPELEWAVARWSPLTSPSWSPDGSRIAAAAGTNDDCRLATMGSMDAFALDPGESSQVALAEDPAKEYNPIWSPDGSRLAFQRIVEPTEYVHGRPCTMAVWIADADGANAYRLDGLGTDDTQPPFWSPDGTRIVGNTVDVIDGVEHYDMYIETVDGSSPIVTVDDAGFATWQPVAALLGPGLAASESPTA